MEIKEFITIETATDGTEHEYTWTILKIRKCFNFNRGTIKDFYNHVNLNSRTIKIIETIYN